MTSLDTHTVLAGEGRPDAGAFRIKHAVDRLEPDTAAFPLDAASHSICAISDHVTQRAADAHVERIGTDMP